MTGKPDQQGGPTGIEAAKIVSEYLALRLTSLDEGDAANIIHILHQAGVRFRVPTCDGAGGAGKSQGLCDTTMTERFTNPDCRCDTYEGNLGPCKTFEAGAGGNCVYCDHEASYPAPPPSSTAGESQGG